MRFYYKIKNHVNDVCDTNSDKKSDSYYMVNTFCSMDLH